MNDLACPKCLGPIRFGSRLRGAVATCYDCWGLWIDTNELNCARESYPVGAALYKATTELDPGDAEPTDLLCPACSDAQLVRQQVREVELEWCPHCRGIYLDKGERERLLGLAAEPNRRSAVAGPTLSFERGSSASSEILDTGGWLACCLFELLTAIAD